jgi:hypothetical protein
MKHDKICTWLGLPAGAWPPDHYALLGLKPGEGDVGRIEQQVHDRLAKLRCYQLSHPEQATEAMNRLAQAFMCLTDPEAKKLYDGSAASGGAAPGGGAAKPASEKPINGHAAAETRGFPSAIDDTAVQPKTHVDWKNSPPPVRAAGPASTAVVPSLPGVNGASAVEAAPQVPPEAAPTEAAANENAPAAAATQAPAQPPVSQPADLLYESARASLEARRGIGTIGALIERIDHTRRLLWAWDQAGKYLNRSSRRLSRLAEQNDLNRCLEKIGEQVEHFPRILGQPGQAGYRIIAMARLEMTGVMFNMLDPHQREALARDWNAGRAVLLVHRQFLRKEFRQARRSGILGRAARAVRGALNDHPSWVLFGIALVTLAVALFYTLIC